MKNYKQTAKALGPWPWKDPMLKHTPDRSGLELQAKKHCVLF